ncbi:MAG: Sec-independent protein translocase protein TatB [Campylobacterota bacterium]
MFGMGFMEILLIAIVAIVALGPEKLPNAMVEVAKFMKKFKSGLEDAKSTFDSELNIDEMRNEANKFKAQIEDAKSSVNFEKSKMDLGLNSIINDDMQPESKKDNTETQSQDKKEEKVSFKKKKKKKKKKESQEEIKSIEESNEEFVQKASDKFKVNFDEKDKNKEENA